MKTQIRYRITRVTSRETHDSVTAEAEMPQNGTTRMAGNMRFTVGPSGEAARQGLTVGVYLVSNVEVDSDQTPNPNRDAAWVAAAEQNAAEQKEQLEAAARRGSPQAIMLLRLGNSQATEGSSMPGISEVGESSGDRAPACDPSTTED